MSSLGKAARPGGQAVTRKAASPGRQRKPARDKAQEQQELYTIVKEHTRLHGSRAELLISHIDGKTTPYPLAGEQARAWVFKQYASAHDGAMPLATSYKSACIDVIAELTIASQGITEKSARKPWEETLALVQEHAAFTLPSSDVQASYANVKPSPGKHEVSGAWRIAGPRTCQLTDCYMEVERIDVPLATSKSNNWHATIRCFYAHGEVETHEVSREEIEDKGLDAKVKGLASWPKHPIKRYYLLEFLDALMRRPGVQRREEADSLGWQQSSEHGLVWQANNSLETAQALLPVEKAPFSPPTLLSPGNGYRALQALPEFSTLSDDIWSLLLDELNPCNWARMYGKLGAAMRVLFPDGTVERAGKLDFVIETVGDGSGQGKSAEDNYVLSLFGIDFTFDRPPLVSTDDTAPSRPRLMSSMRYCPFMTEDRKAREGSPQFQKQHETRKKLIEQYADNTGGGLKMTAYGRSMISRGNPQGIPFLTGNADHSAYALRSDAGEEEAIEWRATTFILAPDEKADYEVSKQVNARRHELATWGTYERRWIMQQYNADKAAFMLRVQSWRAQAEERVRSICAEWPHTRPMNVCIDLVWGMLARQAFIQDMLPETYEERFLWNWIDVLTNAFIEDRLERAKYLQSLIDSRQGAINLGDFVTSALRYILGASQGYIVSQQDKILRETDISFSLSQLGMIHRLTVEGAEVWNTGQYKIGYFLARKDAIAFNFDMLYPLLEAFAQKAKYPLPQKHLFKKQFAETGVPLVKRNEYEEIVRADSTEKINGKAGQYITIPMLTLYPIDETSQDEEEEMLQEADAQGEQEAGNVIPFPRTQNAGELAQETHAQGEQGQAVNGSTPAQVSPIDEYASDPFNIAFEDIPEHIT